MNVAREPLFRTGERVAGRYRVERVLGMGQSGDVYEVQDLELKLPIALKALRSERLGDPTALERFRREITLARRVSHPNVCRAFDLGTHHLERPRDGISEVYFLTMELAVGESLADRIEREGAMPTRAALPLARQMAAGLEAAHAAGVIHRDFKSANVLLAPSTDDRPPHVFITDFGLARLEEQVTRRSSTELPLADVIIGSPAYMAPEQVRSREVSAAADQYAFGVVLYEMVTGVLPFEGDVLATALQKLTQPVPPPSGHVPGLDPRWERVILRCLERDPARRHGSVAEAMTALESDQPPPLRRLRRRHWWLLTGLGALALVAVGIAFRPFLGARATRVASGAAAPAPRRTAVAVLGLTNLSEDAATAWVPKAVAEMLRSELAAGDSLRVVPAETVGNMIRDLDLDAAATLGGESLDRVRRYVHADTIIAGASFVQGDKGQRTIRLDLRAQDVSSGETLPPVVSEGAEKDLVGLVVDAGSKLRQQLGAHALSQSQRREASSALPAPAAAQLYAEGVDRLREGDALKARDLLEQAIAAQADYPLAHAALASAWSALGYDGKAVAEARRAFELSKDLPLSERLWIEGSYREAAGDSRRAAEVLATLWSLHPDHLDYGLRLAAAQARSGRQDGALAVIASLRQLPPPDRDDPRIDVAEAEAATSAAEFRRAAQAAGRAVEKSRTRGQRWLVARALLVQAWAQRNLGETDAGAAAAAEARRLFDESGQPDGAARALTLLSTFHRDRGDIEGSRHLDQEALGVFRRIGNERQAALALNNLGKGLALSGDLATARERLAEALEICRRIEDEEGVARQTNNLAEVTLAAGDARTAATLYREAEATCRASGDRRICADVARGVADAELAQGHLGAAEESYRASLTLARELGHRRYEAYALHGLADVLAARGAHDAASEHYQLARELRLQGGERANAAASALGLARLALANGQRAAAEAAVSDAERELGPEQRDQRALAQALRLRALLLDQQIDAARRLESGLGALVADSQSPRTILAVDIARSELAQRLGGNRTERATETLVAQATRARRDGRLADALEAELVASWNERDATGLGRVEAEARGLGLFALAEQAAAQIRRLRAAPANAPG
jgi:tRNA A-37 threonylcarbamoyl transferase component Bud32